MGVGLGLGVDFGVVAGFGVTLGLGEKIAFGVVLGLGVTIELEVGLGSRIGLWPSGISPDCCVGETEDFVSIDNLAHEEKRHTNIIIERNNIQPKTNPRLCSISLFLISTICNNKYLLEHFKGSIPHLPQRFFDLYFREHS